MDADRSDQEWRWNLFQGIRLPRLRRAGTPNHMSRHGRLMWKMDGTNYSTSDAAQCWFIARSRSSPHENTTPRLSAAKCLSLLIPAHMKPWKQMSDTLSYNYKNTHYSLTLCRPRWSRGNVLASSSKFRGFKPGWDRLIFSGRKILSTSLPGGTLSYGFRVWDFGFVKKPQAWKNRPLSKINRHIHVLVTPKFVGLGGIRVTCSPQDPWFAGSIPAEVHGFFRT